MFSPHKKKLKSSSAPIISQNKALHNIRNISQIGGYNRSFNKGFYSFRCSNEGAFLKFRVKFTMSKAELPCFPKFNNLFASLSSMGHARNRTHPLLAEVTSQDTIYCATFFYIKSEFSNIEKGIQKVEIWERQLIIPFLTFVPR